MNLGCRSNHGQSLAGRSLQPRQLSSGVDSLPAIGLQSEIRTRATSSGRNMTEGTSERSQSLISIDEAISDRPTQFPLERRTEPMAAGQFIAKGPCRQLFGRRHGRIKAEHR